MGVFVYIFIHSFPRGRYHLWIKIIYQSTHDITSIYRQQLEMKGIQYIRSIVSQALYYTGSSFTTKVCSSIQILWLNLKEMLKAMHFKNKHGGPLFLFLIIKWFCMKKIRKIKSQTQQDSHSHSNLALYSQIIFARSCDLESHGT